MTPSHVPSWTLFPPTTTRPRSKSDRAPSRRPLNPRAPPPSPCDLSPRSMTFQNAAKLAEVCHFAAKDLRRGLSFSSAESVPEMTDDHTESDTSIDDNYQVTMSELFDTYYELSGTRCKNQDYEAPPRPLPLQTPPRCQVSLPIPMDSTSDRSWAYETITTLNVSLPSSGSVPHYSQPRRRAGAGQNSTKPLPTMPSMPRMPIFPPPPNRFPPPTGPLPALPQSAGLPRVKVNRPYDTWPVRKTITRRPLPQLPPPQRKSEPVARPLPPLPRPERKSEPALRPSTAPAPRNSSSATSLPPPMPVLEKSVWEHDDEDSTSPGRQLHGRISSSIAAKLHMRNPSTGSKKEVVVEEALGSSERCGKRSRRSASDVLKGIFGLEGKK
ncbi:MAG: hypothetical protein M1818_004948 [Claussenomyces sp. TS43310]|nr:MAG: hypothetical protein M1818_004948 [Claussenomyces sp. TS43310]